MRADPRINAHPQHASALHQRRTLLRLWWIGTALAMGAGRLHAAGTSGAHTSPFDEGSMSHDSTQRIRYRTQQVGDVEVFYREAGRKDAPVLLLLHGFPSASHMPGGLQRPMGRLASLLAGAERRQSRGLPRIVFAADHS